jgi:predicted esterase
MYPYLIFEAKRRALAGERCCSSCTGAASPEPSSSGLRVARSSEAVPALRTRPVSRSWLRQCPDETVGWDPERLATFLAEVVEQTRADASRVYVTGLSMGGTGALDLAAEIPDRIAAATILCGEGDPAKATQLAGLPIWLFHSAADGAVTVEHGDRVFDALRALNAPVTYTRYRDADHGQTWERAYGSPLMYDWFLQHARS